MTSATHLLSRGLSASGAVLAAAGVALSAYASHASTGDDRATLQTAAVFSFGHGVAIVACIRPPQRRLAIVALVGLLLGTLLFSGALTVSRLAGLHIGTAPLGGSVLIVSWLVYAFDALRNR